MVENRLELRLELSCDGNQRGALTTQRSDRMRRAGNRSSAAGGRRAKDKSRMGAHTEGAMIGLSDSKEGWRAMVIYM